MQFAEINSGQCQGHVRDGNNGKSVTVALETILSDLIFLNGLKIKLTDLSLFAVDHIIGVVDSSSLDNVELRRICQFEHFVPSLEFLYVDLSSLVEPRLVRCFAVACCLV